MAWPTATDYTEAVQRPGAFLEDEELRGGEVELTPLGLPMLWSGNFADVYKFHCPATGNTWALKCFTRQVPKQQERYRTIAAHLEQAKLPFTVDFQYLEQGIRINGELFPVLKMRWVEGFMLNQFVEEHVERPQNLKMLLDLWVKLAARLREAEMAHADLQHGNVILVPTEGASLALRLIDYDGMYVPGLAGTRSGEVGLPAYQHPQRIREGTYSAEVDRFSHLVIYTAIRCLMVGHGELWQRFNTGENLLFRDSDFRRPEASELFRTLWQIDDAQAKALVARLVLACRQPLEEAALLQKIVTAEGQVLPLSEDEKAAAEAVLGAESPSAPAKTAAKPGSTPAEDPKLSAPTAAATDATAADSPRASEPLATAGFGDFLDAVSQPQTRAVSRSRKSPPRRKSLGPIVAAVVVGAGAVLALVLLWSAGGTGKPDADMAAKVERVGPASAPKPQGPQNPKADSRKKPDTNVAKSTASPVVQPPVPSTPPDGAGAKTVPEKDESPKPPEPAKPSTHDSPKPPLADDNLKKPEADKQAAKPAANRGEVPSAEERKRLTREIDESRKVGDAKDRAAQIALARKLLEDGRKDDADRAKQFVLLLRASELARDAGEADLMLEAVDAMTTAGFSIEPWKAKARLLKQLVAQAAQDPVAQFSAVSERCVKFAEQASTNDAFDEAADVIEAAKKALVAPKSRAQEAFRSAKAAQLHGRTSDATPDRERKVQETQAELDLINAAQTAVTECVNGLPQAQLDREAFRAAQKQLNSASDDPEACLAAGRWHCFYQDDWDGGLKLLAKGSDTALKSLAEGELGSKPANANEWVARGDRWWILAEKAAGKPKAAMRQRAVHAYQAAMPDLAAGAAKSRVEKRLAQATGKPVNPSQPSAGPAKYRGQVSLDPRTHTIVLAYNFSDKRQLQDFDMKGSGAVLGNGALRVPAGKSIQHLAAFKTVTVRGVLAANPGGVFLTTASGLSVLLQNGEYKLADQGGRVNSITMNHLTPPMRFELAAGSEQVVFQWLNDSNPMNGMGPASELGGIPPEFFLPRKLSFPVRPGNIPLRHIELNGGGSGLVLSELRISGELETK